MKSTDKGLLRLAARVGRHLLHSGRYVCTAESCTGGWIAKALTDVAGSSQWFCEGFVTYSNDAKFRRLGVPRSLIARDGAVSRAVARAMAGGALRRTGAQLAVAVTGIAGPDGAVPGKPVGTVWLCWAQAARTRDSTDRAVQALARRPRGHPAKNRAPCSEGIARALIRSALGEGCIVRLFFAVLPPVRGARRHRGGCASRFRWTRSRRCVRPDNYHMTLAFVGEVPAAQLAIVREIGESQRACSFTVRFDAYEYWPEAAVLVAAARDIPSSLARLWERLHAGPGEPPAGAKARAAAAACNDCEKGARKPLCCKQCLHSPGRRRHSV